MSPKLARFLRLARTHTPAERERKAQRIDFAWSNAAIENPRVTREMVEKAAQPRR